MSTQVQYRRGTASQNDAFVGALAEITVDTTNWTLRIADGVTVGGYALVGLNSTQTLTNKVYNGTSVSVSGNVTAAGATINGDLTVTGNATLSGNIVGDRITNGTTEFAIQTANGNANISVGGTSNVGVWTSSALVMGGNILPTANITYNLGSSTQRWKDLWLSNSTIYLGNAQISANATAVTITNPAGGATVLQGSTPSITGDTVSATGNITGGNLLTGGLVTSTGNITGGNINTAGQVSAVGNVTGAYLLGNAYFVTGLSPTQIYNGTSNVTIPSSSGNISVNVNGSGIVAFTSPGVINNMGNGVGNIGNATGYFNTVFAKATSAQYADVAEKYISDHAYTPGTVLDFGGEREVTISTASHSIAIAGVVSTNPAYVMNAGATGDAVVEVALLGRVPCNVVGPINKGDRLVASQIPGVAQALDPAQYQPGCVIGKALENYSSEHVGTIEVVVGRL